MKTIQVLSICLFSLTVACTETQTTIFRANFVADNVGQAPAVAPPGNPTDDQIDFAPGSATVISSTVLNSNALRFSQVTPSPYINLIASASPSNTVAYIVAFIGYKENSSPLTNPAVIAIKSSGNQDALKLLFTSNGIVLESRNGENNIGAFTPNVEQVFLIRLNMATSTFSLVISGGSLIDIQDEPFLNSNFSDLDRLELRQSGSSIPVPGIPPTIGTEFIIDEVTITAVN